MKLLSARVYRGAIGLYVLCLMALLGGYFGVVLLDVTYSIYVQGPPTLYAGQPQAIRGVLMSAQNGQIITRPRSLTLGLLPKDTDLSQPLPPLEHELKLEPEPSGIFHATYGPAAPAGEYLLVSRAQVHDDQDLFIATAPVLLEAPPAAARLSARGWPERTSRKSDDSATTQHPGIYEAKGPVRIEVIPERPELIRGLEDEVFIRTVDAATGQPIACELTLGGLKGMVERPLPKTLRTDSTGLAKLKMIAVLALSFELQTTCNQPQAPADSPALDPTPDPATPAPDAAPEVQAPPPHQSSARLHIETVAAQVALTTPKPTVEPGATADALVTSLQTSGPVFVHTYGQGRWLEAATFGLAPGLSGLRVQAPKLDQDPIMRVQVYLDMYMQGRAWDERAIAVVSGEDGERVAFERLVSRHANHFKGRSNGPTWRYLDDHRELWQVATSAQRKVMLEAALREVPPHFIKPQAMLNSLSGDREKVEARKQKTRQELLVIIVLALIVGLIALGLVVAQGIGEAQRRKRLLDEIDLELASAPESDFEPEASFERSGESARRAAIAQGAVILGTLVIFGALLIMLLRYL